MGVAGVCNLLCSPKSIMHVFWGSWALGSLVSLCLLVPTYEFNR